MPVLIRGNDVRGPVDKLECVGAWVEHAEKAMRAAEHEGDAPHQRQRLGDGGTANFRDKTAITDAAGKLLIWLKRSNMSRLRGFVDPVSAAGLF